MKKVFLLLLICFLTTASFAQGGGHAPVDYRTVSDCGYSGEDFAQFSIPPFSMFVGPDEHISDHTTHYDYATHSWCADWKISCNSINEYFSIKPDELSFVDAYMHKYETNY